MVCYAPARLVQEDTINEGNKERFLRATGARNHPQNATTCDPEATKCPKSQVVVVERNSVNPESLVKLRNLGFESGC